MRKLWISDIHGYYDEMMAVIDAADVSFDNDFIVIGGDLIDRGPKSLQVVRQVSKWERNHQNVHVLAGNHEDMMAMWVADPSMFEFWGQNGGIQTLNNFNAELRGQEEYDQIAHYLFTRPTYLKDNEYYYIHSGVNPNKPFDLQERDDFLWSRQDFLPVADHNPEHILRITEGRKIIHGHTPQYQVTENDCRIGCDLGISSRKGELALVDLTNKVYWAYQKSNGKVVERDIKQK